MTLEQYCLAEFISKGVPVSRILCNTIAQTHDTSETEDFFGGEDNKDKIMKTKYLKVN